MPKVMCLYIDDSGTRNPDHHVPDELTFKDWFTLGGIVLDEANEAAIRNEHAKFATQWKITYPLRSYDIRKSAKRFSWLRTIEPSEYNRFMDELSGLLTKIPVLGHACVIDRPGYNARYREKYGRQTWQLCKTAFSVVCERAAKYARNKGCKLRVYVEAGDETADNKIREYYLELRTKGMPFSGDTSSKYSPLSQTELADTLYDLKFKNKTSPLIQLSDLYVYPVARGGYDADYRPYQTLKEGGKLIDSILKADEIPYLGIKYSCFEAVEQAKAKKQKEPENPAP